MKSHDGDIELSVTLDTSSADSDIKKLKKKFEDAAKQDKSKVGTYSPGIDKKQVEKDVQAMLDEVDRTLEDSEPEIKPEIDMDEIKEKAKYLDVVIDKMSDVKESADEAADAIRVIESSGNAYDYGTLTLENLPEETAKLMDEVNGVDHAVQQTMEDAENGTTEAVAHIEKFKRSLNDTESTAINLAKDLQVFEQGFKYSDDFVELKKQSESLSKQFNNVTSKMKEMELLGEQDSDKYKEMVEKAGHLKDALLDVNGIMKEMRESGQAYTEGFDEKQYAQVEKVFETLSGKMALMGKKKSDKDYPDEKMKSLKDRALAAIPAIKKLSASIMKMAGGNITRSFNTIGRVFGRMTGHAMQFARQSGRMFRLRDILAYAIGIRSLFSLFTKLRGYITEGTKNLALWRDGNNRVNKSLSDLTSSLTYMKNAWGAAFSPILTIVTPILDKLVQAIADAANALSYLFAKLTGQSTWYKAIRVQKDYAKSLNGTAGAASKAEQKLAAYDKLVMVDTDKGGGGASSDINSMFDEVPIEDAIDSVDDFLDKLKDAWSKADFTDIGRMIGLKLKEALDSIPWDYIKEFARKLAHSIATLLNGFFETEGLADSIGRTIAEAFNTVFSFVDEFVHTLHWDSIGKFIGDGLFSFVDTFDAETAGKAIGGTLRGLIETLYTALDTFAEQGGFELIGEKIATLINTGLEEMADVRESGLTGWEELGASISIAVKGLLTSISTALEKTDWYDLGKGIAELCSKIEWTDFVDDLNTLVDNLIKAIGSALAGVEDTSPISTAIAAIIATLIIAVDTVTLLITSATILIGFDVGKLLGEALFPDDATWYEEFSWEQIFNENSLDDVLSGLGLMIKAWYDTVFRWAYDFGVLYHSLIQKGYDFGVSIGSSLKEKIINGLDILKNYIEVFFDNFTDVIVLFRDNAWGTIKFFGQNIVTGLKFLLLIVSSNLVLALEGIDGFFADIKSLAEECGDNIHSFINSVIGNIETLINSAIDGINALLSAIGSIDLDFSGLPSAIQDKIGSGIKFDLPTISHVSIPRLAQGAVIPPNKEFLAMLGDQKSGVNIETPLDTMVEAFKIAMEDFGGNNNQPIVLQLDGRVIAQAVWDEDRKKYKQTRSFNY